MEKERTFKVGDPVSWTEIRRQGIGFRFSSKEGNVTKVTEATCEVRYKNGRRTHVPTSMLRHEDEESTLTQAFRELGESLDEDYSPPGAEKDESDV